MTIQNSIAPTVDKRRERIQAMFAAIAPRYDLLNRLLSLRTDQRWRRKVIDFVPPDDSKLPVLDVCTGTGDLAVMYARRHPTTAVMGVDFCAPMLALARPKAEKIGVAVEFQEADALALPFDDYSFQVVMAAFGLRNVADTDLGLQELTRVAALGGRVAILEFSTPTFAPLRWLYLAYFKHVLPWIGQRFAPNRDSAYHYLPASVLQFPEREALADKMRTAGLDDVKIHPLTFGVATLYIGRKSVTEPSPAVGMSPSRL